MRASLLSYVALVVASILWGYTYLVLADLVGSCPPSQIIVTRFLVATTIVAIVFRKRIIAWGRQGTGSFPRRLGPYTIPGLLVLAAMLTQQYGLRLTPKPGYAAFLTAFIALFIPVIKRLPWIRDRVKPAMPLRHVIPLIIAAVAGIAMLTKTDELGPGDVLLLVCAACYAGQAVAIEGISATHPAVTFTLQGVVVGALSLLALPLDSEPFRWTFTGQELRGLAYLVLFATLVPFLVQPWAQRRVRAEHVGIIYTTVEPVTAMVFSVVQGRESIPLPWGVVGIVLVLSALLATMWLGSHETPTARRSAPSHGERRGVEPMVEG